MSDLFGAGVLAVFISLVIGMVIGFAVSASPAGELDKICYEKDPDYRYSEGSALYWNGSLSIECEDKVPSDQPLFPEEWKVQEKVQLSEVSE